MEWCPHCGREFKYIYDFPRIVVNSVTLKTRKQIRKELERKINRKSTEGIDLFKRVQFRNIGDNLPRLLNERGTKDLLSVLKKSVGKNIDLNEMRARYLAKQPEDYFLTFHELNPNREERVAEIGVTDKSISHYVTVIGRVEYTGIIKK